MAVNSIIFGGVNSADYGIYISGEGVFNAPKRDVEMISIPGRNGEFALDKGRFENIEVTYPAFNFEPMDYATFAQNLSDFRNAISSLRGYQRLTDTFHPDEYRMATYISGLEIKPIKYNTASEFNIVFNCKPQRWLTSGETAITVASGDTVTNPTLFESSPMLEVVGYGDIGIGGETVTISNSSLGEIDITESISDAVVNLNTANLNTGDAIYKKDNGKPYVRVEISTPGSILKVIQPKTDPVDNCTCWVSKLSNSSYAIEITPALDSYAKGTGYIKTATVPLHITIGSTSYNTAVLYVDTIYTPSSDTIELRVRQSYMPTATYTYTYYQTRFYGDSTKTLLPNPMYIDLDFGEAYGLINGEAMSFNNIVTMPAELPTLQPGANTITKSNTITSLNVVPRWWKV